MKKAWLILENGAAFEGGAFGASGEATGEVVFTTCMTGFTETLTDPNFRGQIVTQTFPLVGNAGINNADFASGKCALGGYIAREYCEVPSNFRSEGTIDSFLKESGIVGLCGIDTRKLTRILRENGTMNGFISAEPPPPDSADLTALLKKIKAFRPAPDLANVSITAPAEYKINSADYHVALLDYGYARGIADALNARGCNVTVLPYSTGAGEINAGGYDGITLSNGAGNPADYAEEAGMIKELALPVLGIGLGHQLLALASGGEIVKLKQGHRGANQPVRDLTSGGVFITSQNHGYAVKDGSLPADAGEVVFINANDKTVEGIRYKNRRALGVQFTPAGEIYTEFVKMMKQGKHS